MTINYDREKQELTRRNFLSAGAYTIYGAALLGGLSLLGRFFYPNVKYGPPSKFDIGKSATYQDGVVSTFIDQKVAIVRNGNDLGAISMVCQHLGCTVAPSSTGFDCPCHGSKYDRLGDVTHGPAQIGLFWFEINALPNGDLQVDKSSIVAKEHYWIVKS